MNNNFNEKELPITTLNIKKIIDDKFFGNVSQFAKYLGLNNSAKINRLFNRDSRNNKYPEASTDVLKLISNKCNISMNDLFKPQLSENKNVNNITIQSHKISGNENIIGNDNEIKTSSEYIDIIKKQQDQIDELINLLKQKL